MNRGARVSVLLLVALAAGSPLVRGFVIAAQAHPAKCHSDAPVTPVPVSHDCCASGHHAAHPSATFSGQPAMMDCGKDAAAFDLPMNGVVIVPHFISSSNGPPGLIPLRI